MISRFDVVFLSVVLVCLMSLFLFEVTLACDRESPVNITLVVVRVSLAKNKHGTSLGHGFGTQQDVSLLSGS